MLLRLKARGVEKEPGVYEITSLPTVEWQFFPNTKKLIVNGKEYILIVPIRDGNSEGGLKIEWEEIR